MVNYEKYRPILVVPAVPNGNGISFLRQDKKLDIDGEIVPVLWKILSYCDGYKNIYDISESVGIEVDYIKEILIELEQEKLINDSREQYRHFNEISTYPAKYLQSLNPSEVEAHKKSKRKEVKCGKIINFNLNKNSSLYELQKKRKSCRNFSNKKLTLSQLGNICNYAYSISRHATPSGGALFPLKIYCIVPYDQMNFKAGYYEYDAENDHLILYNENPDLKQLKYCYNDERIAFSSPLQVVIAADLNRQPYKYANRGYRLTLIEVGQVAQNITLYCEEQGLSTCELGGILDKSIAIELEIDKDDISPILAIAIGYSSSKNCFKYSKMLENLVDNFVGEDKPVLNFGINSFNDIDASFFGAWANYGINGRRVAGATAPSYYEAVSKAIIEAYERYRSSIVRVDYIGKAGKTSQFLTPDVVAPLSLEQRQLRGLILYKEDDIIEWTKDMSGNFYLPTDFIYYGHDKKEKLFCSDSSGVAAYSNYEEAKKRALAELIERDAIMRSWYELKSPQHVNPKYIPLHVKKRMQHWSKKGRKVHVLDMNSKYLPVFLVVIVSDEYPSFVSGAAAVTENVDRAILKAFQEAEYNLLLAIDNPIDHPKTIEKIKTPLDHGQYYHFHENSKKISWLWTNDSYSNNEYSVSIDFAKLENYLEAIYVDLSESKDALIKVVRAYSKHLIPISFGYNTDYYLHSEVRQLKLNPLSRKLPHYFA